MRKQPFSVVLLDEFEKAHAAIWDLFLQVFDDGRLTDAMGHVADFRHCMIILTTNLGATSHQTSGLGFAPAADAFSSDQIMRAIGQTFRPEFQNRLDKVIVFRPLTRDLMREILKKELSRRAGAARARSTATGRWNGRPRRRSSCWRRASRPEMGARPLKRAIDQYLIAAAGGDHRRAALSRGRPVRVRAQRRPRDPGRVRRPDSDAAIRRRRGRRGWPGLLTIVLSQRGGGGGTAIPASEFQLIEQLLASAEWETLRLGLAQEMSLSTSGEGPIGTSHLFAWLLIDRVGAAMDDGEALHTRLLRGRERRATLARAGGRLALQLHLIKEGIRDAIEAAPIEVALQVEPVSGKASPSTMPTRQWCGQLLRHVSRLGEQPPHAAERTRS